MSMFFPYNSSDVLNYLTDFFNIDISNFTQFETLITSILCNLYFFIFWFTIIYFFLKIFNRIWERIF